jgi:hypothetical protein
MKKLNTMCFLVVRLCLLAEHDIGQFLLNVALMSMFAELLNFCSLRTMKVNTSNYVDLGFHEIEKVINHRVEKRGGKWITTFRCRWKKFSRDADTWEPLANLETCPKLLGNYILMKTQRHRAYEKINRLPPSKGRLRPPNKDCLQSFGNKRDLWYIPEGDEFVKSILSELKVGKETFLAVVFRHLKPDMVHVPQCLMEYYFPLETALLYLRKKK